MANDAEDKQHQATGKRLADLRKKGSALRSKDLSGGVTLLITILLVVYLSPNFQNKMNSNFNISIDAIQHILRSPDTLFIAAHAIIFNSLMFLLPLFIVSFLGAWLSPFLFGGWNFTFESINFNIGNLNPITNLAPIFSPKRAAVEILKSMFKSFIVIGALIYFIFTEKNEILSLLAYPVATAIEIGVHIIISFVSILVFTVIIMVMFDIAIQYTQYHSKNKMSTQELKDESKDTEGNQEVKRKIRSKQHAMMKQRLHSTVPKAHVIVTNPTHYAVALRYDENKDRAPKVVAKGKNEMAQQIRLIAATHGIPIYEAPPLARALFHTTKPGFEIKVELYMAVAIVLTYVHQLKNYQQGRGILPQYVSDLKIPDEYIFTE